VQVTKAQALTSKKEEEEEGGDEGGDEDPVEVLARLHQVRRVGPTCRSFHPFPISFPVLEVRLNMSRRHSSSVNLFMPSLPPSFPPSLPPPLLLLHR